MIFRWIKENKWLLIFSIAMAGFILGFRGYYILYSETKTVFDIFYYTMRLFLINVQTDGDIPWELQAARFILPLMTWYIVFVTLMNVFSEKINLIKIRSWKGHVIICGLSHKGYLMALDFKKRNRIVVIEKDPGNILLNSCKAKGIYVIIGDATESETLYKAGVLKAKYLLGVSDNDITNTEIAVNCDKVVKASKRRSNVKSYIHLSNKKFCDMIEKSCHRSLDTSGSSVKYFNIFEYSARRLFEKHPPDAYLPKEKGKPCHILVFGFDSLGESVVIQALKIGHYPDGRKLQITVIDEKAKTKGTIFHDRFPEVKNIDNIELEFIEIDMDNSGLFNWRKVESSLRSVPSTVFLSFEDDIKNVTTGYHLNTRAIMEKVPVIISINEKVDFASILQSELENTERNARLYVFKTLERICTESVIIGGEMDRVAKWIHEKFIRARIKEKTLDNNKVSHNPWERLPEIFKESNRQQADHISVKVRAIGAFKKKGISNKALKRFKDDEVEFLAKMEHFRWNAEKYLNGWVLGKDRDRLESPYLVPWEDLSEQIREYDREAVRNVPLILRTGGYGIYRKKN